MSGKKTYTLLLNSTDATNRISGAVDNYVYYVNWGAILPQEYTKFDLSFQFRSTTAAVDPVSGVLLSVNMGSNTMYDQSSSSSSILGAILPKSYVTGVTPRYFYESNNTDDCGFIAIYPSNSYITVKLTNYNGSAVTNFPASYILQLCFTVIE